MSLSKHQISVINHLRQVGESTKADIYANSTMSYYCNWEKHVGDVLSRMVNAGLIKRVKKGVYTLGKSDKIIEGIEDKNQTKLF